MLKRVNLKICPGEFVAIVGESGIGKTTLIRILMAFLETGAGTVDFYNGSGQRQETGAFVRKFIAYVPQGNTLFSGTVRENLQMGREDASEEELWAALKLASGENFVRSLLDEATEVAVLQGLRALEPRPTCLLITHRKGVLKYCDRELCIREGSVTEECSTTTICTA